MTSRTHWKILVSALLLSGCQSSGKLTPWFASREPVYTSEELASLENPRAAAARPELASTVTAGSSGNPQIRPVSATTTGPPVAAGKVDDLVRFGQAAIREAGQNDPGKLNQARDLFSQALALDGTSASAHHGMAIVADLQQDWTAAEMHYKQALRSRTQDPSLLNDIGYSYLLQGRYHEASQYLNQALQFSPKHERAHINLALLSLKRGDRAAAQTRLGSIYSAVDAQTTLARLERDLQATAAAQPATAVAMSNTTANGSPQPWPEQGQFRAEAAQPRANLSAPAMVQNEQPVHVYPPGVVLSDPPASAANQQFRGANGNNYPPPQNPAMANMQQMQHPAYADANGIVNSPPQYNPNGSGQPNQVSAMAQQNPYGTVQYSNSPSAYRPPIHPGTQTQSVPQQGLLQQMNPQQQQQMNTATYSGAVSATGTDNYAPVAGLNAGPGALFPVGVQSTPGQNYRAPMPQPNTTPGAAQQYPANPSGQNFNSSMNVPATRNGAMYPTPAGNPPTAQQTHDMQMRNAAPLSQSSYQPNYQSNISPASSSQYVTPFGPGGTVNVPGPAAASGAQPGYGQQQYGQQQYGQQGQGYGQPAQTAAVMPPAPSYPGSSQVPPSSGNNSPLAAYERQLQSIDNQYNRALQQMDGTGSGLNPAPGQYR